MILKAWLWFLLETHLANSFQCLTDCFIGKMCYQQKSCRCKTASPALTRPAGDVIIGAMTWGIFSPSAWGSDLIMQKTKDSRTVNDRGRKGCSPFTHQTGLCYSGYTNGAQSLLKSGEGNQAIIIQKIFFSQNLESFSNKSQLSDYMKKNIYSLRGPGYL